MKYILWLKLAPVAGLLNKEGDVMWDDRLTALVEEIGDGLRDGEGMCDANDDEYSKVSECFTYNSETFESGDTLTRPVLSEEDIQQRDTTESDD